MKVMTPHEICAAMQETAVAEQPSASDQALLALRDLIVGFIDATTGPQGYPASMKALTMEQVHSLNRLHLAVGL